MGTTDTTTIIQVITKAKISINEYVPKEVTRKEKEPEFEEHHKQPEKFKLFIGFRWLGIFDSIMEAKKYAGRSGLWGAFNLLGDKGYRDSWYVFESEVNKE
jgi:hypothetical protein